jgi:hypothetical protein
MGDQSVNDVSRISADFHNLAARVVEHRADRGGGAGFAAAAGDFDGVGNIDLHTSCGAGGAYTDIAADDQAIAGSCRRAAGHVRKRNLKHVSTVRSLARIGFSTVQKPKHERCCAPYLLHHSSAPCFWGFVCLFNANNTTVQKPMF